jgi:flagellar biosynthetic protein FlhB
MMLGVPQATVVITNPTHFAVAVRYEKPMDAPVVVAKGAEQMALRIRETAMEHEVPIVERKELARALYRGVEVGQAIPADLYKAVAEILAYVYRLKGFAPAA